jgi:RNA polymerase sigma-70 factor (ECF subfamily)
LFLSLLSKPDRDAPLVTAARAGDVRAFDALVYRYQSRLSQFVKARLDSAIDADDVTQDVFVTAWRELPNFRGRSRFKTWLFGIALNLCADAWRRHQRLRNLLGDMPDPMEDWAGDDWKSDPYGWSEALLEREDLRRRVRQLSENERQVLELYYYAELNLPEISQLLQVNLSTLKYRFYQAHRHLRQSLEKKDEAPIPVRGRRVPE